MNTWRKILLAVHLAALLGLAAGCRPVTAEAPDGGAKSAAEQPATQETAPDTAPDVADAATEEATEQPEAPADHGDAPAEGYETEVILF